MIMEAAVQGPARAARGEQPPRRRKSRWFRLWWILPLAIVLAGLVAGVVWFWGPIRLRFSEPYRMALEQVQKDPQVMERLGEPVKNPRLLPFGSLGDREGTVNFGVEGPKGQATVTARFRRISEAWGLTTLNVTFEDGQRVSLETGSASGLEDAPKWSPPETNEDDAESAPPVSPEPEPDTEIKVELPDLPKLPAQ
jgi:hypothetical protein